MKLTEMKTQGLKDSKTGKLENKSLKSLKFLVENKERKKLKYLPLFVE